MPLSPKVYADLLASKIKKYNVPVWLVNTGWSGGAYGVGERMDLVMTRAIIQSILEGSLAENETRRDSRFGFEIPIECPGVKSEVLNSKKTWKDPEAYEDQANELAQMFIDHFKENFSEEDVSLVKAGPKVG
jgi:phosphoenolpyruvate carboxykinase (ATP)